jgi:integrase/recombinase XerD
MAMFKRRRSRVDSATGKRTTTRSNDWYARLRDSDGILRTVRLCRDKQASEAMLNDRRAEAERVKAGMGNPFKKHHETALADHLTAFGASMEAKDRTEQHVRETVAKLTRVFAACGFRRIVDLNAGRLAQWLREHRDGGMSPRTSNAYLVAAKAFGNWLVSDRRHAENPFVHVSRVNQATDVRVSRRAASVDEVVRLLAATETRPAFRGLSGADRAMLYRTALETGFRVGELASLTENSLSLSGDQPTITVEAGCSKRRRQDQQPIRAEFAAELRAWLAGRHADQATLSMRKNTGERLWPGTWREKAATMIRADLETARSQWASEAPEGPLRDERESDPDFLQPVDSRGGTLDFHALRHTFITRLTSGGVSPKLAQELARHSTITLTMDRYSHVGLRDTAGALDALPNYRTNPEVLSATGTDDTTAADQRGGSEKWTRKGTRLDCVSVSLSARPFTASGSPDEPSGNKKTPANTGVSRGNNPLSALGFEPRTYGLKVRCSTD